MLAVLYHPLTTNLNANQVKGLDGADAPDSAAIYVDADLRDESSVKKALAQGTKAFGGIDGLVNVPPPPPECNSKANGVLHDLNLQSYQVRSVGIDRWIDWIHRMLFDLPSNHYVQVAEDNAVFTFFQDKDEM